MRLKLSKLIHLFCFILGSSFTLFFFNFSENSSLYKVFFNQAEYDLIIIVLSKPSNSEERYTIRSTWGESLPSKNLRHFFAIGTKALNENDLETLINEQQSHNDLLLLPVNEKYDGLTLKVLKSFLFISNNFKFNFVLKCDDDSFLNIKPLVQALSELSKGNLYWGYFNARASVFSKGKWKEKDWFLCDKYLPYALGGGYVLSRNLVKFIADNHKALMRYKSEDVSVGTWLSPLNITRIHDIRFNTQYASRGCRNYYLVMHKQTPSQMMELHSNLAKTNFLCSKETISIRAYSYDWKTLPHKCCSFESPDNLFKQFYWVQTPTNNF